MSVRELIILVPEKNYCYCFFFICVFTPETVDPVQNKLGRTRFSKDEPAVRLRCCRFCENKNVDLIECLTYFHNFGLHGLVLSLIESYLTNSDQFVKTGHQSASIVNLEIVERQCSVSGPLPLSASVSPIGDVMSKFSVKHHQQTDDMQLYFFVRDWFVPPPES